MVFVNSQKDMINQRTEEILLLKEERTKEIDIFIQLIDTGVKTEVTKQMKPLETKQTAMESVQNDIINRMNVFEHELSVLKENRQSKVSPLNPPPPIPLAPSNIPANATVTTLDTVDDTKIKEIVGKARRTIGLHPIDKYDLERIRNNSDETMSENDIEKLAAIEFLRDEMKISENDLLRMEINKIWKPVTSAFQNCLWVEFALEASVFICYGNTFRLKPNHRLKFYTPHQFHNRGKYIKSIADGLRLGPQKLKVRNI